MIDVAEIVAAGAEDRGRVPRRDDDRDAARRPARAARSPREADFFSFGTNDLTQTTLGFCRDDAESKFLTHYLQNNVITSNPFETIDMAGVGKLVDMAVVERGRRSPASSSGSAASTVAIRPR